MNPLRIAVLVAFPALLCVTGPLLRAQSVIPPTLPTQTTRAQTAPAQAASPTVSPGNEQTDTKTAAMRYAERVRSAAPLAWWRFDGSRAGPFPSAASTDDGSVYVGKPQGELQRAAGPRPPDFPGFSSTNGALRIGGGGYLRVADQNLQPGLDFHVGDAITLEAWVRLEAVDSGRFYYIVGKGRTGNPGMPADNQNYALRLKGIGGGAGLSFLFRSADRKDIRFTEDSKDASTAKREPAKKDDRKTLEGAWHRWNSGAEIGVGDGWHHVAVSYEFGKSDSLRAYVDGRAAKGTWDMGGATDRAPVVDDDELWIGSSMRGQPNSTFHGDLDEVAIYRRALTADEIKSHYEYVAPTPKLDLTELPETGVLVQLLEGIPDRKSWEFRPPRLTDSYTAPGFIFLGVPKKYSPKGIHIDRSNPLLLRATGRVVLPRGEHRILIRCRNASRLYIDERQVLTTDFNNIAGTAHGKVVPLDEKLAADIRPLRRGDTQSVATIQADGKPHVWRFEMIVGGRTHRPDFGETGVFVGPPGGGFRLLSDSLQAPLTRDAWPAYMNEYRQWLTELNAQRRRESGRAEHSYWDQRHELARAEVTGWQRLSVPELPAGFPAQNAIDHFIGRRLAEANRRPAEPSDDLAFLRRLTLDTIGLVPTESQIEAFLNDPAKERRRRAIDRLLEHPSWADHWVGYWQDVLAENPNIINPTLNNTGPFRWWIHESFADNKPLDRFVTELVMMEGSQYYGGPAGFAVATQNDVPMAAKANIVGQAFLGLNMKCARCHDAPFHDVTQRDLFSLAAMLKRSPQAVPASSSVPGAAEGTVSLLIEVNLKPGESVAPEWAFSHLMQVEIPDGVLRDSDDTRERLAALITLPTNRRFARVFVNRLWQRYLGRGLVERADDWQDAEPSHPELLDYLARELVAHDYDIKHVARLIFASHAYQRRPHGRETTEADSPELFASPVARRMTAEQLVDSLFVISGKPFDAGPMNIDIDGSRSYENSIDLGVPTRSWHFASLSNERDRPSLSLPFAEPFITLLEAYGWRSSRQDPLTRTAGEPNSLQPAILANGVIGRRATTLTDDSRFTHMALQAESVEQLVDRIFLRVLTRHPDAGQRDVFTRLLSDGFETRRTGLAPAPPRRLRRDMVGWSNHLDPEANVIKKELEAAVQQGEPATVQLDPDWRERLEDMIWSLVNSPEFVFIP